MQVVPIAYKGSIYEALVDDDDYDLVCAYKWRIQNVKRHNNMYAIGYLKGDYKNKSVMMHRLIMNAPKGVQVHHKNDNGLDNQKSTNLEILSIANHQRFKKHSNKTGFKAVYERKDGRYYSQISIDNKKHHLGIFDTPLEAHRAYLKAREELL